MVNSTSKLTEWRWALPWAPLWLILFFVLSKKNYKTRINCQISTFLVTLNNCHPSISFTMEIATNGNLPFVGIEICKKGCKLVTSVNRKPENTGLLLHHQSHVDNRYKRSLVTTMFNRAFRLSSTFDLFTTECERLKLMFFNL